MKQLTTSIFVLLMTVPSMAQTAKFDYFKYQGNDERFNVPVEHSHQYLNPILAGYYPDPSVCRVGDTYYLVNSSFAFFPGVPISMSKDLVNWTSLGHVLDRESQLPLYKERVSGGIYAPAITYNKKNKTFYMITTNVAKGNFFVKTKDPAKGWSEPIYLPQVNGIDPSFFFDKDGKGYIVHNAPVVGKAAYEGQRAIRLFEFDVKGDSIKGTFKEILRGGTHVDAQPIWIEGPHLFRRGNYYYLMCAEGGTGTWHSEVILRAKHPFGPWEEYSENPILTQRTGLDPQRKNPVSSAGHADLVEDAKGNWWAVFLACRPYEADLYNTGRDTYLLPVTWKDNWPVILEKNTPIPVVNEKANLQPLGNNEYTGNAAYEEQFDDNTLHHRWMFLRNPSAFYQLKNGQLIINPLPVNIYQKESLSAIWVRQQNSAFVAETSLNYTPQTENDIAGLALLQNEDYNFVFGKTLINGVPTLTLSRAEKGHVLVASAPVDNNSVLRLKIEGHDRYYDFYYAEADGEWLVLAKGVDAANLSTHVSGGFIGACIGLYASSQKENK